jgi:hypothetical protein
LYFVFLIWKEASPEAKPDTHIGFGIPTKLFVITLTKEVSRSGKEFFKLSDKP